MSTPFSSVYGFFTPKVSDYSFLSMSPGELEDIMFELMRSAIIKFKNCKKDLADRDDIQFTETLTDEEREIIGTLMVVEWLDSKINSTEMLKQVMSDKDFRWSSQAQHLKELKSLRQDKKEEADDLMKMYDFNQDDLEGLR